MSDVDALTALARAALPRFGLAPDAPVTLIHRRENAVFRVDAEAPHVLRVHRLGYRSAAEVRSELAWMEALRADGIATPPVRQGIDGDLVQTVAVPGLDAPRHVDLLGWVDGAPLAEGTSLATYRLLGATSARIQLHARGWAPPAGFTRPRLDVDGLVGPRAVWGDYADLDALTPEQLALVHRAAAVVRRRLAAFGEAPDRFGLTHGDLMPDNVLVAPDGTPTVIDFDDAGTGWYLYDLATLLAVKLTDDDHDAARDAWIAGYRGVAPLPDAHCAEIETLVMARLLLGLGWMHTRRDTEMAQSMTGVVVWLATEQAERLLAREGA